MKHATAIALFVCAFVLAPVCLSADLVTLSPDNYEEFVPKGKEVDAFFGDYALRNDRIVAIVADPTLMVGRSGSRKYGVRVEGKIIDLALRQKPNDLLGAYDPCLLWPSARWFFPEGMPGEPHKQKDFTDEAEAHKQTGRQPVRDRRVTLTLPFKAPAVKARYTLEDGWPCVLVEMVFKNAHKKPVKLQTAANLFMSPKKLQGNRDLLWGLSADGKLAWVYDRWFGQAYGVLTEDVVMEQPYFARRPSWVVQRFLSEGGKEITLEPGATFVLKQRVFPAGDLFGVRAVANQLAGIKQQRVRLDVSAPDGPVEGADVTVSRGKETYGAGRTGKGGVLEFDLPAGQYDTQVAPFGRPKQALKIDPSRERTYTVKCEAAAIVNAEISDEAGGPIPCKVEFRGVDGTPDPFFFPDTGEHLVRNLCYTQTGRLRQVVPPGSYQIVITHGPEYDAVFRTVEAARGKETALKATLVRSVDTKGWISADFGNRSTVSRPFSSASQLGRVLNLLGEHVEFAPATERDSISDFAPHLKALGAEKLMATCPGIGLTQRVRKTWTSQNSFPVIHKPGKQDGGALQRPQHVFQVFWLGGWYGPLTVHGNPSWSAGTDKLLQVTPPGIWPYDGRSDGMSSLFAPRTYAHQDPHRNGRLSILHYMDAMEVQPLDVFLDLPAYDPADPKGEKDIRTWWDELEERHAKKWPSVKNRNRQWPRILNLGYTITGVVNSNARYNFHGSGGLRNFVKSPTDDPAKVDPLDVVHAVRFGHVVMSTGPFLEVELDAAQKGARSHGIPGDDVSAPGGKASLHVRAQCPNWISIDRVQVLFNGFPVKELTYTRRAASEAFGDKVVQFDRTIPLELKVDTHVMVLVAGEGPNLRARRDAEDTTARHIALSNPVWVDVDGDGFKPHSPVDDAVWAYFDIMKPLLTKPTKTRASIRLYLKNLGRREARDTILVQVLPEGAARIVGTENRLTYKLAPGQQTAWDFEVELAPEFDGKGINLYIPRSTLGEGRRSVGRAIGVDKKYKAWTHMTAAQRRSFWWLPEHVSTRPENWGNSWRWKASQASHQEGAK